jgi:hypothetical protein
MEMDDPVRWNDLISLLQWIAGGVALLIVTVGSGLVSLIIAGFKWTHRIEESLGYNLVHHRFIYWAIKQMHPNEHLPEHLPGDDEHGPGRPY